jgi:hypothetical protein
MEYALNHGTLKLYSLIFLFISSTLFGATEIMDFDLIKKGKENNNTLLVVGGIQGDEPGGFMAASILSTHYEITKGSVWIVPNLNFHSIIARSRGPYGDMNRKFAKLSKKDPEYHTVQRIKSYITDKNVKLIVNLHDGSGFYRHKYIDKKHSPLKWGQCSIIDQSKIAIQKYGELEKIATKVVNHVNLHLISKEDIYHLHNTRTVEGDKEMEKTLTYFAINNGKAAFGNEASKNLPTHKRVYYHLLALEKYMDIMGIEYKRKFKLTPDGVYHALNNDIYVSFYDSKIKLPLSQVRSLLKYFPIKKGSKIKFKASNPLLAIIKRGDTYIVQYGNRRLSKLSADYIDYDNSTQKVTLEIDGKAKEYNFGSIIGVKKSFIVKSEKGLRVNIIGYSNKSKRETDIKIVKSLILKRYSIDKSGNIYRVEYYNKNKFVGMILIKFES